MKPMTLAELALDARITRAHDVIANAIVANGDKNPRVVAAALLSVLQENDLLSQAFEELCGKVLVSIGLKKARSV